MRTTRAPTPSPLAGEGAARTRSVRAAGEGPSGAVAFSDVGSRGPSPGHSLRSRPASPAREREMAAPRLRCAGAPALYELA